MSLNILRRDSLALPRLFIWSGPVAENELKKWLVGLPFYPPDSLIELWATFGAGDIFESETLFAPFEKTPTEESVLTVTNRYRASGLPKSFYIFHEGVTLSAYTEGSLPFVELDPHDLSIQGTYGTFDDWYENTLRIYFAERYRLSSAADQSRAS
jgi:hypothetical protein